MKPGLLAMVAVVCLIAAPAACAHRLDELLAATTIAVGKDRVVVQVRLTPGAAVADTVLDDLDTDKDGILSPGEQRVYADRVLHNLSLTVDGLRLPLGFVSSSFPTVKEIREGLGEILLRYEVTISPGGSTRRLVFENHYRSGMAAYLVNCLLPNEPDIRVVGQSRNFEQSFYQLDYTQSGDRR